MKPTDFIVGPPSGTLTDALAFVRKHAKRVEAAIEYVNTIFEIAPTAGIDPAIAIAQSAHETANYTSEEWVERLNPAGLGVTDGVNFKYSFASGREAALAQLVHLSVYAQPALGNALKLFKHLDPRYQAVVTAGWQNTVRTIDDLTGKWATDRDYAAKIATKGTLIFKEKPLTQIAFGRVPHPPFQDRLITTKPERVGWDNLGPRTPRGVVLHRMLGTLWGTDSHFRNPTVDALTDYGVGNSNDGVNDGVILRWSDPRGIRSGRASGPVNDPYGDGLKFVNTWGVNAVNRDLVSIEISGHYETPWSGKSFEAVAQLVAQWADACHVLWSDFPMITLHESALLTRDGGRSFICWHQEFTGPSYKQCPGAVVMNQTDALIERVRTILKQYQVIEKEYRVNPKLVWPTQSTGLVGKLWESESRKRQSWGRPDPLLWNKSDGNGGKLYLFTDGLLIRRWSEASKERVGVV